MVGCWTFRRWRYGGRCYFGCFFFLFSPLLFTSSLLWILAQYKWRRHGFLPPPETSQVEVEFPCAPVPPNSYQTVLISCGTYGFIRLRTLNGCSIVSFLFLLLYGFMQPRGSAPKEGDNVTARLYVTCPGPGNTRLYSRLAMSLRSLAIILPYLPIYYSTILTSTCATVSTDIPSYEAIHGRIPLQSLLIARVKSVLLNTVSLQITQLIFIWLVLTIFKKWSMNLYSDESRWCFRG